MSNPFTLLFSDLKGSTVNMNIMGSVYNKVADMVGSTGHTALGGSLMIGKFSFKTFAFSFRLEVKLQPR